MTLCSKCLYYDFHIFSSVVKVLGVQKAYIMYRYLMNKEELSPLFFNAYTLITDKRTP